MNGNTCIFCNGMEAIFIQIEAHFAGDKCD